MTGTTQDPSPLRRVAAISFDGDMTLWDFRQVMRHSLEIVLVVLQARIPGPAAAGLTIDRMIEIRNQVAEELRGRVVNLEEVRFHAFRRTLEVLGSPDDALAAKLNALYLKHRFEDIELYDDVVPALDAIGSRFPVGLVSNGNGYPDRCGLPDRFRFVVFSQDVGVEKPHPGMFLAAARAAGCGPEELMHVGDSLANDVAGANGVGAISVWLNREGRPNTTGFDPDHEITSLSELTDLLDRHEDAAAHDPGHAGDGPQGDRR